MADATTAVVEGAAGSPWIAGLILLAGAGAAALLTARPWRTSSAAGARATRALRAAALGAALWAALQLAAPVVAWGARIPHVLAAALGGAGLEALAWLYARERAVIGRGIGRAILAVRLLLFLLVLLALLRPAWVWRQRRVIERRVAVLVDESASMQIADRQWTPAQRLEFTALFGAGASGGDRGPDLPRLRGLLAEARQVAREASPRDPGARRGGGRRRGEDIADPEALAERGAVLVGNLEDWIKSTPGAGQDGEVKPFCDRVREKLLQPLKWNVERSRKADDQAEVLASLGRLAEEIDPLERELNAFQLRTEEALYARLPAAEREALDKALEVPRIALADRLLSDRAEGGQGWMETLAADYQVDPFVFGARAAAVSAARWTRAAAAATGTAARADQTSAAFRAATDLAGALDQVRQTVPPDRLAGVLVLTDGNHNGERAVDDVARRLGAQGAPVKTVVLGGRRAPLDAAILDVRAPDAVPLHDRVRAAVQVRLTGAKDRAVKVKLLRDGAAVDERAVKPTGDDYLEEVRLGHVIEQGGVSRYEVQVDTLDGERSPENNRWPFEVAVSDDRTKVLLIDDRPRWEFRYLRNLFFARDKSVHLQYVLMHPDVIEGQATPPRVVASAARPFGESEANALPEKPEDWLAFDAIILGDLAPDALPESAVKAIGEAVTRRGALLVVVAGPRAMPRRWTSAAFRDLMPVTWAAGGDEDMQAPPEREYVIRPTPEGRRHPALQMADSDADNDAIWSEFPPLRWRAPLESVKSGAEALAYALDIAGGAAAAPDEAARAKRALLAAHSVGAGKVVFFAFDQTWRLRYQTGDLFHHRLWSQLLRWGAGETLRAGARSLRLGSDRLCYEPGQEVRVRARLLDRDGRGVSAEGLTAAVYRDGKLVRRVPLAHREGSQGVHEGAFVCDLDPGELRVKLEGDEAEKLRAAAGEAPFEMPVLIRGATDARERARLTADTAVPQRAAQLSGGLACEPSAVTKDVLTFGPPSRVEKIRMETPLWDTAAWLTALVGLATLEWILRRKGGLP